MIIYDYERNKRNTTKKNSLFTTCAVFMYSRLLILVVHCHHSALFGLPSWPSFYNLFFWRHIFCVIQSVQWCSTHLLFWVNKNCKIGLERTVTTTPFLRNNILTNFRSWKLAKWFSIPKKIYIKNIQTCWIWKRS